MTLLDAYALVALLADEPAADDVARLLREGASAVVIANLAEALDVTQRIHGLPEQQVRDALEPLLVGGVLASVVSEERDAWSAAALRRKHYDRRSRALSLADCFLLAHALAGDDEIATADSPLANAARSEGVGVVALPDSAGVRP